MVNATTALMTSWYSLLNGNVSGFTVYKEDVPDTETGNYIVLRAEGGGDSSNKDSFAEDMVVVVDIVSIHQNNIDRSVVEGADSTIVNLVRPTPSTTGLDASGLQILNVRRETFTYLAEDDGSKKYYRKVSRYAHWVHQT